MSTDTSTDLLAVVSEPHLRAMSALEFPDAHVLPAVAWCSAHLAAVDRVLYGAVRRHVPRSRQRLHAARQVDHHLQQAIFRLDRRLTGDVHLVGISVESLAGEVRQALEAHVEVERRLVAMLQALLSQQEQRELAAVLLAATAEAPTRPHPYTRHTPLAGVVASVDALVDRVRDVLDNRVAPLGRRRRRVRPAGRWGSYLMAAPYPTEQTTRQEEVRS